MKKIFYTHVLILLTLFCSCDLLDIKPVNSMLPKSVEDFESVLLGGYPRENFFINTDLGIQNLSNFIVLRFFNVEFFTSC